VVVEGHILLGGSIRHKVCGQRSAGNHILRWVIYLGVVGTCCFQIFKFSSSSKSVKDFKSRLLRECAISF